LSDELIAVSWRYVTNLGITCSTKRKETVQNLGVRLRAETGGGPSTPGDGMVPVERAVGDRGSYFQHQVGAPRRPAHLLLSVHSAMQQRLHRALSDRRRNRFFALACCRVVDDDI
jgi:hypothetical protein